MDYKIILNAAWKLVLDFLKTEVAKDLKEALLKAVKAFGETLWNEIRGEVVEAAKTALQRAEDYCASEEHHEREKKIVDGIIDKMKLPLIARPFKGLIKKIAKEKVDDVIKAALEKGKELTN